MKNNIVEFFNRYFAKLGAAPGDEVFNEEMREMLTLVEESAEARIENRATWAAAHLCRHKKQHSSYCFEKRRICDRECDHTRIFRMHMNYVGDNHSCGELTERAERINKRINELLESGVETRPQQVETDTLTQPGVWSERER